MILGLRARRRRQRVRTRAPVLESPPTAIVVHELPSAPLEVFSPGAAEDAQKVLDRFWGSKKPNTREAYENDAGAFAAFLGTDPRGLVGLLRSWPRGRGNALAIEWHTAMVAAGLAPATRARRLGVIRALTKTLYEAGAIEHAITTQGPKVRRLRDTEGPPEASIHRMLEACGDYLDGKRNRVIIGIFVTMGLRRAELAGLAIGDYDRERRRLHILGKGEEEKIWKDVPDELAGLIEAWLAATGVTDPKAPLVHALRNPGAGEPLSLRGLGYIIQTIGEKAGVKVWPHALRHSAGTLSIEHGHDLLEVQGLLRHANPATTMLYLDNQKKRGGKASRELARVFLGTKKEENNGST